MRTPLTAVILHSHTCAHTHRGSDYACQALRNEIKQNGNLNLPFNMLPHAR